MYVNPQLRGIDRVFEIQKIQDHEGIICSLSFMLIGLYLGRKYPHHL